MARKKCTIIASGNSLRGFDFSLIKGHIIAINPYVPKYTRFDWVVAWDMTAAIELSKNPETKDKLHTLDTLGVDAPFLYSAPFDPRLIHTKRKHEVLHSSSSAVFALNIAVNHGYNDITILGCDNYCEIGTPVHFYDEHPCDRAFYDMAVLGVGGAYPGYRVFAHMFWELRRQLPKKVRITAVESGLTQKPYGIDVGIDALSLEDYKTSLYPSPA